MTATVRTSAPDADLATRAMVEDFLYTYAATIDRGEAVAWPNFFTEQGTYRLMTLENVGFRSMSLFVDRGREALKERAAYIAGYWGVKQRKTLHTITNVLVTPQGDGLVTSTAYLVLYRVARDGQSAFHTCGEYHDTISVNDDGPLFVEHTVILDADTLPGDMTPLL